MPEKLDFKNAASTVSVIITNGTEVLLVERKHNPFKGKWALPGGFHECDKETLEEAAIREIKEETDLVIAKKDLNLVEVNSEIDRDPRGHVIDHVFICMFCKGTPKKGSDANAVKYFNLSDLPELAFDHKKDIDTMIEVMGSFSRII